MDTMANQVPSHQVHVSESSANEESGLSAAFWQERYDAQADDTSVSDQMPQTMQVSALQRLCAFGVHRITVTLLKYVWMC